MVKAHPNIDHFGLCSNLTICVQTILFSLSPTGNYNCLVNSEIGCHHKTIATFLKSEGILENREAERWNSGA